ncbi:MAG: chitin deacetylase [Rhodospirillaceae bacterium]|nr:chitin deacetylase [Rhodospirillaceae bacterium]
MNILIIYVNKITITVCTLFIFILSNAVSLYAADSAVILQYHRFGEADYPSTNIKINQFEDHIDYLKEGGFNVLPVPHIIAALRANQSLPDKTIGITIDDALISVYKNAWPRLTAAGFPFTLFVSTDSVDHNNKLTLSWNQIRELADAGVTIGNHSAAHKQMWKMSTVEKKIDLDRAQNRFLKELKFTPKLFAYPFGEFDINLRDEIKNRGFNAAFGQQSGVSYNDFDFMALPRFSLNEAYSDIERFKLIVNTLPLKITDLTPQNPVLSQNPPIVGFTVSSKHENLDELACFASAQGKVKTQILGDERVEIRLQKPMSKGRNRINCTLPGSNGRWHWLGLQFIWP